MKLRYDNDHKSILESWINHLADSTGIDVIFSVCSGCNEIVGAKLGNGVHGISDSLCPECYKKTKDRVRNSILHQDGVNGFKRKG